MTPRGVPPPALSRTMTVKALPAAEAVVAVASTVFVAGHSYLATGFSTATAIRRLGRGGQSTRDYGNLEDFALVVDGRRVEPVDRNIWGVTFAADDRTFFATASTRGEQWLVRGDLAEETLTTVRRNAECPSLSPDGRRVAYKKRVGESGNRWAIAVLDLASGEETILGEERSVDDQVEWLDDETLLYGLARAEEPGRSDVWAIRAHGESEPALFLRDAWSPSVVR